MSVASTQITSEICNSLCNKYEYLLNREWGELQQSFARNEPTQSKVKYFKRFIISEFCMVFDRVRNYSLNAAFKDKTFSTETF